MPEQDDRHPVDATRAEMLRVLQAKLAAVKETALTPVRAAGRALDWANTPTIQAPPNANRFKPSFADDAVEALSTPASLASLAATGGSTLLAKAFGAPILRGLQAARAGVDLAQAGQGVQTLARGVEARSPGQMLVGAGQTALGAFGLSRSVPPLRAPVPDPLGPWINPRTLLNDTEAETIRQATLANGGNSTRLAPRATVRGDLGGRPGHAVGIFNEDEMVIPPTRAMTARDLQTFTGVPAVNRLLQSPRTHLGTWHVAAEDATPRYPTGSTVIDVGVAPTDEPLADRLMRRFNQKGRFNTATYTQTNNPAYNAEGPFVFTTPYQTRLRAAGGEPENWREALIAALKTRSGRSQ